MQRFMGVQKVARVRTVRAPYALYGILTNKWRDNIHNPILCREFSNAEVTELNGAGFYQMSGAKTGPAHHVFPKYTNR